MRARFRRQHALPWLAAFWLGCAGPGAAPSAPGARDGTDAPASGGRVASGFPPPESLYELRERPLREGSPFGARYRDVDRWQLAGPFPDTAATQARPGGAAWDPLLDELLRERAGLAIASAGMECFAREVGRFLVEHRAQPGLGLQRFLAGRCAVVTATPALVSLGWESSRPLDLEAAVRELREPIAEALREHVVGGPLDVGMWVQAGDGRVDLVIARGDRGVRLDPVPTERGPIGTAVLSGEVLQPVAQISASVTRGAVGWGECRPTEGVVLPRFRFECPLDPDGPSTWVSLYYLPAGHVLSVAGAELLIRAPGEAVGSFERRVYADPRPVTSAEQVPAAFLEAVNQVRARAEAPPLALAREQSRVAAEVAPYYFGAIADAEAQGVAELVALGMMAGWEVPEIVQEGMFLFMWLVESRDVSRLLSDALELPSTRQILLAADLERIAIGPLAGSDGESEYLALIASTYRLFSEAQHREYASRVAGSLTRARVERGRRAPRELDAARPLAMAAAARVQAGGAPQQVLGDLIQESVDALNRSVVGWAAETQDLDDLAFPEDFLDRDDLEIAISVSTRRPEGEAWGRFVVLMVAASGPDRRQL